MAGARTHVVALKPAPLTVFDQGFAGIPYMYALYVCLICMPYMYAPLTVFDQGFAGIPYMYALNVCLICMPYMYFSGQGGRSGDNRVQRHTGGDRGGVSRAKPHAA